MADLIVTESFGEYSKGDRITDAKEVADMLAANARFVVQVAPASSTPAPKAPADPAPEAATS